MAALLHSAVTTWKIKHEPVVDIEPDPIFIDMDHEWFEAVWSNNTTLLASIHAADPDIIRAQEKVCPCVVNRVGSIVCDPSPFPCTRRETNTVFCFVLPPSSHTTFPYTTTHARTQSTGKNALHWAGAWGCGGAASWLVK
jgi:hypothetical protein